MLHQFRKRDLPVLVVLLVIGLFIEWRLRPENGISLLWIAGLAVGLCVAGVLWENRQAKKHPLREPETPWQYFFIAALMGVLACLCLGGKLGGSSWPVYAALSISSLYSGIVRLIWERKSGKEIEERLKREAKENET